MLGDSNPLQTTAGDGPWAPKAIVVDGAEHRRSRLVQTLRIAGCDTQYYTSADGALRLLEVLHESQAPHLVVSHSGLAGTTATAFLEKAKSLYALHNTNFFTYAGGATESIEMIEERLEKAVERLVTQRRLLQVSRDLQAAQNRLRAKSTPPKRGGFRS